MNDRVRPRLQPGRDAKTNNGGRLRDLRSSNSSYVSVPTAPYSAAPDAEDRCASTTQIAPSSVAM